MATLSLHQYFEERFPSLTAHIDNTAIDALLSIAEECEFSAGDTIIEDNSPSDKLLFILDGTLSSFIEKNGKRIELGEINSGDVAGEISMFGACPTTASVVAKTNCKLLSISKSDLNQLKTTAPSFVGQLLKSISHTIARRLLIADKLLYQRFTNDEEQLSESHGIASISAHGLRTSY